MQDFNPFPVLVETIVDVKRGMEKTSDLRMSFYGRADVRKGLKQLEVIEEVIGKLLSCFGMPLRRPRKDFLQIS